MNRPEELQEFLANSKKSIGEMYPVLKTPNDFVIDGVQRMEAGWEHVEVKENINSYLLYLVARLATNTRRNLSTDETKNFINRIAEELTRQSFMQTDEERPSISTMICELTGLSQSTVLKYLKSKYKKPSGQKQLSRFERHVVPVDTSHPNRPNKQLDPPNPADTYKTDPETRKFGLSKRRAQIEIIADILSVLSQANMKQLKKTVTMYRANINWEQNQDILEFLIRKGYVEEIEPYFRITAKGQRVLGLWYAVVACLRYEDDAELPIPMRTAKRMYMPEDD